MRSIPASAHGSLCAPPSAPITYRHAQARNAYGKALPAKHGGITAGNPLSRNPAQMHRRTLIEQLPPAPLEDQVCGQDRLKVSGLFRPV
ncbi:hypothetical protein [Pseudomonas fluorescens]|uniref:hypothetical protein n=1 Tax=Pseudomonas fluorescens TaxID=294 RepID=UPI003D1A2B81